MAPVQAVRAAGGGLYAYQPAPCDEGACSRDGAVVALEASSTEDGLCNRKGTEGMIEGVLKVLVCLCVRPRSYTLAASCMRLFSCAAGVHGHARACVWQIYRHMYTHVHECGRCTDSWTKM
eukprot:352988-Chlamydomonas_euryale.AAC.8